MPNAPGTPGRRKPPRAEPIQPDRPGRGTSREDDAAAPSDGTGRRHEEAARRDEAQRRQEQSDDALDNVREGYD